MLVVHRAAQRKHLKEIAIDVEIALQIGLADIAFVERAHGFDGAIVVEDDFEFGLARAQHALRAVRHFQHEARVRAGQTIGEFVDQAACR